MERFQSILLNETELATTGLKRLIVTDLQPAHEEILRAVGPEFYRCDMKRGVLTP